MPLPAMISGRSVRAGICTLGFFTVFNSVAADVAIRGRVLDDNGQPLAQAMVTVERHATEPGVAAVSVFTDVAGEFVFPIPFANAGADQLPASAKLLGYRQVNSASKVTGSGEDVRVELTLVLSRHRNQAGLAPASAWLGAIANLEDRAALIMNCIGCHQLPAPEVRDYARAIEEVAAPDPAAARLQSWQAMAKYMNFLSAEEFGRGNPNAGPVDADRVYGVGDESGIAALLAKHIQGSLDRIEGYQYGAPLAVTAATVIREYAIDAPNNVREALMIGSPPKLWGADVASNNVVQIDVATGQQRIFRVPSEIPVGPHTLVRGHDNSLWVAPFFNGVVSRLDPVYGDFQVWNVRAKSNPNVGIHDLSFDYHHELVTDQQGRIWYSDITNNAVGYFHPQTGAADIYRVPEIEGRPGRGAALYGLVMTSDHKYVWYTQFGIGSFGCFNTETMQFETSVSLPLLDSGPRRITISDQDILYVPLYGAGQLIEYDTRNRRQIGIYDLPDRASAPYAVTWDDVRQVVWIPTSNANVIYRFDPRDKSFSVLPLPREQAFLRMVGVEPETGVLVSAYGNIVETVHGPRMAVVVDPGDDYPAARRARRLALGGRE